ncbi:MAG: hypothetical protein IJU40_02845, partial [Desulfovibrionaceae bacterium]|nr:hypothetical protein [Desulfovibrionaceae bacterium]
ARGCLRGVIMTAQEMQAKKRLSWIGVTEEDLASGQFEDTTFRGIQEILSSLSPTPPLVLIYLSCIHKFANFDYDYLLSRLKSSYPEIIFIDCHMMPTMRKSGPNDEQRTYAKMYQALTLRPSSKLEAKSINFIANDRAIDRNSLLITFLKQQGYTLRDICTCKNFKDYLDLAKSSLNLTIFPDGLLATKTLSESLKQNYLYLPLNYSYTKICANFKTLCATLNLEYPLKTLEQAWDKAQTALQKASKTLKGRPLALDYTFTPKPLSLARLLLTFDFNLTLIYLDAFDLSEEEDFLWLKANFPDLLIVATLAPEERFAPLRAANLAGFKPDQILALGQKAAFLASTKYFVNWVLGGGYYDFTGLIALANSLEEAHTTPKKLGPTLLLKGLGCVSCVSSNTFQKLGR